PDDVEVQIWLGWHSEGLYEVFTGKVQSVESGFGRKHGGRRLWVDAFGTAMSGKGRSVVAEWGRNLIAWRIKPYAARPQAKAAMAQYYDLQKAIFGKITKAIGGGAPFGNAEAITQLPALAPNSQVGDQTNEGQSTDSQRRRGTGWVQLNGEPQ